VRKVTTQSNRPKKPVTAPSKPSNLYYSSKSLSKLTFDEKQKLEEKEKKQRERNELWLKAKSQANNYLKQSHRSQMQKSSSTCKLMEFVVDEDQQSFGEMELNNLQVPNLIKDFTKTGKLLSIFKGYKTRRVLKSLDDKGRHHDLVLFEEYICLKQSKNKYLLQKKE